MVGDRVKSGPCRGVGFLEKEGESIPLCKGLALQDEDDQKFTDHGK